MHILTSMLMIVFFVVGLATGGEKQAKAASITITYNLSGGQVSPSDSTKVVKKTYTQSRITLEKSSYYYPGKSIIGWATSSGGSKKYDPGQIVTDITSNITLYAVWGTGVVTCNHSKYTQQIIVQTRCERDGKAKCTCSSCGKTWEKTLTAPGHKYGNTITVAATCEKPGEKYKKCSVCGTKKTESIIKALGHSGEVVCYWSEEEHLIECNRCGEIVGQTHKWTLKNSETFGQHWYECTAEGCTHPMKPKSCVYCYTAVTNWSYYVDSKSNQGANLHVREGDCPVCKMHVIEYGMSTLKAIPSSIEKTLKTVVKAAKFALTLTPHGTVVNGILKIHTAITIVQNIYKAGKVLKASCENEKLANELAKCDLSFFRNLEPVSKGTQSYSISVNLFNDEKRTGVYDIYQKP